MRQPSSVTEEMAICADRVRSRRWAAAWLAFSVFSVFACATCSRSATRPDVPLNLSVIADTIDAMPLPVPAEEHPGAMIEIVEFKLSLWPDGQWTASGSRRPLGGARSDTAAFKDNGTYQSSGSSVLLHSNFTHADSPATLRGDTMVAQVRFPITDTPHVVVLRPE